MKLTKLMQNSVAIKDGDEYAIVKKNPLRMIKITAKQYNMAISVANLLAEVSSNGFSK